MSLEERGRGRSETQEVSVMEGNRKKENGGVIQDHGPRNRDAVQKLGKSRKWTCP